MKSNILSLLFLLLPLSLSVAQNHPGYTDGLPRATPESQGIPSKGILQFIDSVQNYNLELHSLMLLRHGKVIAEAWWNPYKADTRHIMYSVSKTVTSTAMGFAVAEKRIKLEDKIISFFPEYQHVYTGNVYMKSLTIKNLLTMSAGTEPFTDFRLRDKDWVKAFLSNKVDAQTSSRFCYNSYAAYMISAILQRVTGCSLLTYLQPRLFEPLGISDVISEQSPAGIDCGGWGMCMKTADMAKIGQLYLQKGQWNGRQILPASWIEEATKLQTETSPNSTQTEKVNSDWAQGYGYFVWRCRNNAFRADGSFGQYIVVMPNQDMVLAMTANINDMQKELQCIWNTILPVTTKNKLPEDKAVYERLVKKMLCLQLPVSENTESQMRYEKFSGIYTIANNDLGIRNIALAINNDSCSLTIRTQEATHNLLCGQNNWKHSLTDKNSPYYNEIYRNSIGFSPFVVAGNFVWEDHQHLLLKFIYTEDSSQENYHITIDGQRLILLITNSENPDSLPVRLVGYLN